MNLKNIKGRKKISESGKSTMGIQQLSKFVIESQPNLEHSIILEMLQRAFKLKGDDGVIERFKGITGVELEALSKGKYVWAN